MKFLHAIVFAARLSFTWAVGTAGGIAPYGVRFLFAIMLTVVVIPLDLLALRLGLSEAVIIQVMTARCSFGFLIAGFFIVRLIAHFVEAFFVNLNMQFLCHPEAVVLERYNDFSPANVTGVVLAMKRITTDAETGEIMEIDSQPQFWTRSLKVSVGAMSRVIRVTVAREVMLNELNGKLPLGEEDNN